MKKLAKSPKVIDLSQKSPEELLIYLHAILGAKRELIEKSLNFSIHKKPHSEKQAIL